MEQLPRIDFNKIASNVFEEFRGFITIGGKEIDNVMRKSLREEAKVIQTYRFWEILHATILQEASNMALVDSQNWEHVQIAKMLKHWDFVFENMLYKLAKD